jgi:hypothetical protein
MAADYAVSYMPYQERHIFLTVAKQPPPRRIGEFLKIDTAEPQNRTEKYDAIPYCAEVLKQGVSAILAGCIQVSSDSKSRTFDLQQNALTAFRITTWLLFEDDASGAVGDRHGLAQALSFANAGDVPVVRTLDRLGRFLPHLLIIFDALKENRVVFRALSRPEVATLASSGFAFIQTMNSGRGQSVHRDARGVDAGVFEQQVEPADTVLDGGEEHLDAAGHDDVVRHGQRRSGFPLLG